MTTTTPASTRRRGRRPHRRRLAATLLAVVLGVTALAACEPDVDPPHWTLGTQTVTSAGLGPHISLDWPDAVGATRYQVQVAKVVGGTPQTWTTYPLDAPATTACLLVGLPGIAEVRIRITAFDAADNWSGDLTGRDDIGTLHETGTTPSSSTGGGPVKRCVPLTDGDADRAPDALENGIGSPTHGSAVGTDPADRDSDDDGLEDGEELYGAANGLDLPGLGTTPLRKDILLEVDWASQISGCSADLQPLASWVDPIEQAFATMPISGPPGGPDVGIRLIVDHGQGGLLTGGNAIPDADGRLWGDPQGSEPASTHFAVPRRGYFHYATLSTEINVAGVWGRQGVADKPGDTIKLGIGCGSYGPWLVSSILMHELGHNLDLHHGGHEPANRKPNYGSVMNYRYMSAGADGDCDGRPDNALLAYSESVRGSIDENAIDEVTGFCPGVSADVDLDGSIDPAPYAFDVNGGGRTVLHGSDDMEHMDVAAFNDPNRSVGTTVTDPLP